MERPDHLEHARARLRKRLAHHGTDLELPVQVRPLDPDEAIGKDADPSFVIKRGKERVIEATFLGHKGQAFTDRPGSWTGSLGDLLVLALDEILERFQKAGKPLILFGNTISGVASLLNLERLCPFGRSIP